MAIFTFMAAALRFRNLDSQSMWSDELFSVQMAMSGSWEEAMGISAVTGDLYGWFIYHYSSIFGNSDFALRSTSAVAGVALIPLIAETGRQFHNENSGIISAAILAVSFHAVRYSQEFRPYMLVTFILWTGILLLHCRDRERSRLTDLAIISLFVAAFIIHYFAALAVVVCLILYSARTIPILTNILNKKGLSGYQALREYFSSNGVGILRISLALLILAIFNLDSTISHGVGSDRVAWIPETPEKPHLVLIGHFFADPWGNEDWRIKAEIVWIVVMISPLALYLTRKQEKRPREWHDEPEWLLWLLSIGTLAFVVAYSSHVKQIFVVRYMTFFMPAWILLVGITLSRWIELVKGEGGKITEDWLGKLIAPILSIVIFSSGIPGANIAIEHENKTDFKGSSLWMEENIESNDAYIVSHGYPMYWNLYLERQGSSLRVDDGVRVAPFPERVSDYIAENNPLTVVYLQSHTRERPADSEFEESIWNSYDLVAEEEFFDARVRVFALRS